MKTDSRDYGQLRRAFLGQLFDNYLTTYMTTYMTTLFDNSIPYKFLKFKGRRRQGREEE